ncbi:hypothetical protein L596_027564 [Steinernema carpocapsae]|uniref:FMN hydroxy acid dehydrogenase domain-containing protein n=1 Tax=Steinernema carpocapsae TaxID=34508 RepID=A0A4U5LVW0_STECR|nr:hypothetical protein L596_027564 [Steinernema carpocapsae]
MLPKAARDYYRSGADDEMTLKRNRNAYQRLLIRPFCLRDVSQINTKTSFKLGETAFEIPFPVGIAPTAFHRMANDEGEKATVRGACKEKTIMICSSLSTTALEDVAKASSGEAVLWFQLYIYKDRKVTQDLIARAVKSGFKAIVLTVDTPIFGRRRADERNAFQLPYMKFANFMEYAKDLTVTPGVTTGSSGLWEYANNLFDASINWKDLEWLVKVSPLPIIVKGVMRADDTFKAIQFGASGVIVSNHGGRQLDYAAGTIEVLPEVVRAADGRIPVFVDGGVRSGTTFSRRSRSALKRSSWAARCSGDSPSRAAKESATSSTSSNPSLSIP